MSVKTTLVGSYLGPGYTAREGMPPSSVSGHSPEHVEEPVVAT